MRNLLLICLSLVLHRASAQGHSLHATHNMLLYGNLEVFASHLVYKAPHNYQVILKIFPAADVKEKYLREKLEHPKSMMLYLLDKMLIQDIDKQEFISGRLDRLDEDGQRVTIVEQLRLEREDFQILYLDELPLSLENGHGH